MYLPVQVHVRRPRFYFLQIKIAVLSALRLCTVARGMFVSSPSALVENMSLLLLQELVARPQHLQ